MAPGSSGWIGAWWLGFVIAGTLLCIAAIPLLAFPGELLGDFIQCYNNSRRFVDHIVSFCLLCHNFLQVRKHSLQPKKQNILKRKTLRMMTITIPKTIPNRLHQVIEK
jgi:hypothetical protein